MVISANGRKMIESFEGLRLTAYRDVRGIPTIGYGHTGPSVVPGMTITQDQADAFMAADLDFAEQVVNQDVKAALTQNQFDALVSLVYNIGGANFYVSTVLRKLNQGTPDYVGAAEAFLLWCKTNGEVNPGLLNRRNVEMKLFLTPPTA